QRTKGARDLIGRGPRRGHGPGKPLARRMHNRCLSATTQSYQRILPPGLSLLLGTKALKDHKTNQFRVSDERFHQLSLPRATFAMSLTATSPHKSVLDWRLVEKDIYPADHRR